MLTCFIFSFFLNIVVFSTLNSSTLTSCVQKIEFATPPQEKKLEDPLKHSADSDVNSAIMTPQVKTILADADQSGRLKAYSSEALSRMKSSPGALGEIIRTEWGENSSVTSPEGNVRWKDSQADF